MCLQGMDFDLRLLRRTFDLPVRDVFDTVIAARMLGLREFSYAALVQQYFGVTLAKGSQKANWARRPLPPAMEAYAKNDTHFLLPLAAKMEEQMRALGRMEWFRQSCQRALEQTMVSRERDPEEAWRITGSGTLPAQTGAVLRAIWQWRDREAQQADRPSFHILQNSAMIEAAKQFVAGETPEFPPSFRAPASGFLAAARAALELPESAWPQRPAAAESDAHARVRQEGGGTATAPRSSREGAGDRPRFHRAAQRAGRNRRRSRAGAKPCSCSGSAICSGCDSLGELDAGHAGDDAIRCRETDCALACFAGTFASVRGYGLRTNEPRQGRNAATVV